MPKTRVLIGPDTGSGSPATAEAAAQSYFTDRQLAGNFAPKPPVARWRADQRERFEKELERLEDERQRQTADAVKFAERP